MEQGTKQVPCVKKRWVQGIASANWIQVLLPAFLLGNLHLDDSVKHPSMPRPGLP